MKILLVRHARAEPRRAGLADPARALTSEGRARFVECRGGLKRLELLPSRILHSPWLRATQTAALLSDDAIATEVDAGLARAPDAALVAELTARTDKRLACVGHEPWLTQLACLLVGLPKQHADSIELKKSGVLVIERVDDAWKITAQLPPRVLRRLGASRAEFT